MSAPPRRAPSRSTASRIRFGTSTSGIPEISSPPNAPSSTSRMIAGIAVTPMNSGCPINQPRVPPALIRRPTVSAASAASPLTWITCRIPASDRVTAMPPTIRRGRCSGSGSLRISTTATTTRAIGKIAARAPIHTRTASSAMPPTGPAACSQVPIAQTTASAINPNAMPSRRWAASMSLVAAAPRPMALTALPSQRAASNHSRRRPRPMPLTIVTIGDCSGGGAFGVRTVALLPAVREFADLAEPEAEGRLAPERDDAEPDPRAGVRPAVDPEPERASARAPDRESAREPAGVFPAIPPRYPFCHTNHTRHTGCVGPRGGTTSSGPSRTPTKEGPPFDTGEH